MAFVSVSFPQQFTRILISIEYTEDIDGAGGFIDGEGDRERETLHRFAADVLVPDSGDGWQLSEAMPKSIILEGATVL